MVTCCSDFKYSSAFSRLMIYKAFGGFNTATINSARHLRLWGGWVKDNRHTCSTLVHSSLSYNSSKVRSGSESRLALPVKQIIIFRSLTCYLGASTSKIVYTFSTPCFHSWYQIWFSFLWFKNHLYVAIYLQMITCISFNFLTNGSR
jgi:hypothetical protein